MNVDHKGQVVPNMATNFWPWFPVQFFTNTAIRLLANAGFTVGNGNNPANLLVTNGYGYTNLNIQVWPTNFYTPSVHRLFQLAANIYDSTTNRPYSGALHYPYLPSVFRPMFTEEKTARGSNIICITGFMELTGTSLFPASGGVLFDPYTHSANSLHTYDMLYGVPLVIGAKKGLPNFNQFAMETLIQVTRRLDSAAKTRPSRGR